MRALCVTSLCSALQHWTAYVLRKQAVSRRRHERIILVCAKGSIGSVSRIGSRAQGGVLRQ